MGLPTPDYGTTWVVVYYPAETLTPAPAGCTLTWSER